jgi:hypothetical protein
MVSRISDGPRAHQASLRRASVRKLHSFTVQVLRPGVRRLSYCCSMVAKMLGWTKSSFTSEIAFPRRESSAVLGSFAGRKLPMPKTSTRTTAQYRPASPWMFAALSNDHR